MDSVVFGWVGVALGTFCFGVLLGGAMVVNAHRESCRRGFIELGGVIYRAKPLRDPPCNADDDGEDGETN